MNNEIDFRELLIKKYMKDIISAEGIDFIPTENEIFYLKEISELSKISNEIMDEMIEASKRHETRCNLYNEAKNPTSKIKQ